MREFSLAYLLTDVGKLKLNDEGFFHVDRKKRQAIPPLNPVFFDELNVTDDIAMTCEGNRQCIFDLIVTGDMAVAMDTLNHDRETNLLQDTICKA